MRFLELKSIDLEASLTLLETDLKSFGKPDNGALKNYYFDDAQELFKVFAVKETDIIRAMVFVEYSREERTYILRYVIKQKNIELEILISLLKYVLDFSESIDFYRFYVIHKKYYLALDKLISSRYDSYTEEIISKNKKSSFEKYWLDIQLKRMYNHILFIKVYCLKEKLRGIKIC